MTRTISGWGFRVVMLGSIVVVATSIRYALIPWNIWINAEPAIRAANQLMPIPLLLHAMFASIALATGPFQFLPGLRTRRPKLHRWTGRVYAVACIVAGAAGLIVATHASGGPIAGVGFAALAVTWIATTAAAWRAALARDFDRHRMLMRYSFAMTFAAVTLRLQVPIGLALLGFHSYADFSRWLAYTCWIPNLIAVRLYSGGTWRRPAVFIPYNVSATNQA